MRDVINSSDIDRYAFPLRLFNFTRGGGAGRRPLRRKWPSSSCVGGPPGRGPRAGGRDPDRGGRAPRFQAWEKTGFAPEKVFLERLAAIDGISQAAFPWSEIQQAGLSPPPGRVAGLRGFNLSIHLLMWLQIL